MSTKEDINYIFHFPYNYVTYMLYTVTTDCTMFVFISYFYDMFRHQFLAIFRELLFLLDMCSLCVNLFGSS
jgi:hypothetical protein